MLARGVWLVAALLGVPLVAVPSSARAASLGGGDEAASVEAHGFVSQGFIKSTDNNYLADSKRGSFEFTEVGINFTTQPTERLRLGTQLFSNKLGATGNFNVKADWFYVDYRWRDWFGIRAGRVKLPFGLYNDTSDIDAARVPVLLPQSVYPIANRDYLLAQTGLELYGYVDLRKGGALDYRLYGGTIYIPLTGQAPPVQVTDLSTQYVVGGRLMWDTPVEGLRVGGSLQILRLDFGATFTLPAAMPPPATMTTAVTAAFPVVIWVSSLEYAAHDWLLAAEYSRWHAKVEDSSDPTLLANAAAVSERAYAMTAYRVRRWLQPGVYYSLYFPNVDMRTGPAGVQHDASGTLRFDINDHWLVKVEGHYMHGTAALVPALNNGTPASALTEDWGVFFVKTTAYF